MKNLCTDLGRDQIRTLYRPKCRSLVWHMVAEKKKMVSLQTKILNRVNYVLLAQERSDVQGFGEEE